MRFILSDNYWNGKYHMSVEVDTPLGRNSIAFLTYVEITKEMFDSYLRPVLDGPESFNFKEQDDGKNKRYIITPKYLVL